MAGKRKKSNYGICNSCESFLPTELKLKCAQGLDNAKFNAQTKSCKKYMIKEDFVERYISIELPIDIQSKPLTPEFFSENIKFHGVSNSNDIDHDQIWVSEFQAEIIQTYRLIAETLLKGEISPKLMDRTIVSLDIETTNWMPSAQEGYINHICQSFLHCTANHIHIATYQIINMNRKPENVGEMLKKTWKFMENGQFAVNESLSDEYFPQSIPDIQLVFNKGFDIRILKKCFSKFELGLLFPETVVDLMKFHKKLASLEEWLKKKVNFSRTITEKGNYSEYYALFKKKQIEPISTYNIIDTLTPLLAYIVMND